MRLIWRLVSLFGMRFRKLHNYTYLKITKTSFKVAIRGNLLVEEWPVNLFNFLDPKMFERRNFLKMSLKSTSKMKMLLHRWSYINIGFQDQVNLMDKKAEFLSGCGSKSGGDSDDSFLLKYPEKKILWLQTRKIWDINLSPIRSINSEARCSNINRANSRIFQDIATIKSASTIYLHFNILVFEYNVKHGLII